MKKFISCLLALTVLFCLCSCDKKPEDTAKTDVRVITLKGPTGIGMVKLMDDAAKGMAANNYTFTAAGAPDEVSSAVISGSVDIAAMPVNLASVLYSKKTEITFLAVNTLGVLYLLENGNEINSISDLRGKTVYATGNGATPQYIIEYLLSKNGLEPGKDVTVEYLSEHAELASKLAANDVSIGILPEPNVTSALISKTGDLRIALNLTEEWNKVCDTELVQGVIAVSNKFLSEHPEAVNAFIEEYKKSVSYILENTDSASVLCETYGIVPKAAIAKKAIPNCNICCITGKEANEQMKAMLGILFDANPKSVGGALPGDNFYYEESGN